MKNIKTIKKMMALTLTGCMLFSSVPAIQLNAATTTTTKYYKSGRNYTIKDSKGFKKVTVNGKTQKKAANKKKYAVACKKAGKYTIVTVNKKNKKKKYVVYIDKKAPTISGVEQGATYTKNVKVKVKDNYKLKSVTLNGKSQKSTFKITKNGLYKIVAKDMAGNTTKISIFMHKANTTPTATPTATPTDTTDATSGGAVVITPAADTTNPIITGVEAYSCLIKDSTFTVEDDREVDYVKFCDDEGNFLKIVNVNKKKATITVPFFNGYTEDEVTNVFFESDGFYICVYDTTGNCTKIGPFCCVEKEPTTTEVGEYTDGMDITAPVISGVEEGATYNDSVTVTVTDNIALDTVTVNDKIMDKTTFTIFEEEIYEIVATDKNGNMSSVVFIVEPVEVIDSSLIPTPAGTVTSSAISNS